MNAEEMKQHICETFDGIRVMENAGDIFLIYDPEADLPDERTFPFVTIVTGDNYDSVSALDEPGAYRLNIGLTKGTYTSMFGAAPTERDENGILVTGHDHAARDRLTPHPIYASQYWVAVVNPGPATRDAIPPLLAEAHAFAARKYANARSRLT
ncbi:DUF6194 family protein [Actinophytocola gossypii]|uniref:DUF6194 domain-containing protein n=1 Tax=Actinophytocola gossypii TaxID=2812003 RepID=A0ABT2JB88_9PSEU|nr:DUF6194 family protein [Actinophytocola gossypii]MCT2585112.1 hypothetical protein [Actinophytocola gossypii]